MHWLATVLPLCLLVLAAEYQGAFEVRHWAPVAILTIAVLATLAFGRGLSFPERGARVACAALWALAGWALLSAVWAASPADAIEGGGRTLLYAALLTLSCAAIRDGRTAARVGALLVVGVVALAALTFVRMLVEGPDLFVAGRLDDPVGYRNATGCLFAIGFWPLVAAAARRDLNALARAFAITTAALLLGGAFLTQARGVALGLLVGGVVVLGLGPDRLRRAWLAIALGAGVAIAWSSLLAPFDGFRERGAAGAGEIAAAVGAIGWLAGAFFALGLAGALLDGGLRVPKRVRAQARHALVGGLAALLSVVAIASVAVAGDPVAFVDDRATEFRSLETASTGETRLTFAGGQRADLWRVALIGLAERPLTGVGEGSYRFGYYEERRTDRNASAPHGLVFRVAAELGIVGLVLLAGVAGGLLAAVAARWRGASPRARRSASALLGAGVVGAAHATVDWLWLIPGVTGMWLLALGLAVAALRPAAGASTPAASRTPWLGVALSLAVVVVALTYVGDVLLRQAQAVEPSRPAERLSAGERAQRLNPLSPEPLYVQAGALEALDRPAAARARLLAALRLEPRSFVTQALLGDLETRVGRPRAARRRYRRALALNPLDVGLRRLVEASR